MTSLETSLARHVVDVLCKAYFHREDPMKAMAEQFDKIRNKLIVNPGESIDEADPSRQVIKLLTCFLRSTLITEYNRIGGDNHQETSQVVCDVLGFPKFADAINASDEYIRWTHIVLSIVSYLRLKSLPVSNGTGIDKDVIPLEKLTPDVLDVYNKARLLFYGILFSRLCSVMYRRQADKTERFYIEICLFMAIVFFYFDYVQLTKAVSRSATTKNTIYWDTLYRQVNAMYIPSNSPFFTQLKLGKLDSRGAGASLKSYLSQDTVIQAHDCITTMFLHPYRATILDMNQTKFDLVAVRQCLSNMQAFRMRMSRWFRNTIVNNIRTMGIAVGNAAGKIYKKINYAALFARQYPVATVAGTVAFALAVYQVPKLFQSAMSAIDNNVSLYQFAFIAGGVFTASLAKTAWVLVFKDFELQNEPELRDKVKNETAPEAPYLELTTSDDGLIDTIYRVAPLPPWPVKQIDPNPKGWAMTGGEAIQITNEVQHLKNAMKRGYSRDEVPEEMSRFIRKATRINTGAKRRGGGVANNPDWKQITTPQYGDDVPANCIRYKWVGEGAEADKAVASFDGINSEVKIWIPHTKLQTLALGEAHFVADTPDPSEEMELMVNHSMTNKELLAISKQQDIPLPPVLPPLDSHQVLPPIVAIGGPAPYYANYARKRAAARRSSRSRSRSRRRAAPKHTRASRSKSRRRSRNFLRRRRTISRTRSKSRSTRRSVARPRSRVRYGTFR